MIRALLDDARDAAFHPRDFYARVPADTAWWRPALALTFWTAAAASVGLLLHLVGLSLQPSRWYIELLMVLLMPLVLVPAAALGTLVAHALWRLLGAKGTLGQSWTVASSLGFTVPLQVVLQDMGPFVLVAVLWRYWLLAEAGRGVHGLSKPKAWGLASLLGALDLGSRLLT